MHVFRSSTSHKVKVPLTVTKAADVIVAICNRNDTHNVIGNRIMGPNREGWQVPVTIQAMSHILGSDLGANFYDSIGNPAYREFYTRVIRRTEMAGITIAFGDSYWYIIKKPRLEAPEELMLYAYNVDNLQTQGPAGVFNTDIE